MIKNYGLFYSYFKENDLLEIYFSDTKFDTKIDHENVELFYNKNELVKANVYGIKKYVKIRINGLIYFPSAELIALINGYLGQHGIMLGNKTDSGYYIDKEGSSFLVKAKVGTFLSDKTMVKKEKVCTFKDLSISESENVLVIENGLDDKDIGKDFFAMEEHENVGN